MVSVCFSYGDSRPHHSARPSGVHHHRGNTCRSALQSHWSTSTRTFLEQGGLFCLKTCLDHRKETEKKIISSEKSVPSHHLYYFLCKYVIVTILQGGCICAILLRMMLSPEAQQQKSIYYQPLTCTVCSLLSTCTWTWSSVFLGVVQANAVKVSRSAGTGETQSC